MSRYDPLRDYLAALPVDRRDLTMSFGEIEDLVGQLPRLARSRPSWWANTDATAEAQAWQEAGWLVQSADLAAAQVTFARNAVASVAAGQATLATRRASTTHGQPDEHRKRALERICFFSDAVFAISITLLGLDLTLPAGTTASTLPHQLASLWPKYAAFAFTFTLIGLRWLTHHLQFYSIRDYDYPLLGLNLALLLVVAFLPFPSRVLAEYPDSQAACALYVGSMAAAGLLSTALWFHACRRKGLVDDRLPESVRRNLLLRWITLPTLFGISLILLYVFPHNFWPARLVALATPLVQIVIAALTPKTTYDAGIADTAGPDKSVLPVAASG